MVLTACPYDPTKQLPESCIAGLVEFLEEAQPLIVTTLLQKAIAGPSPTNLFLTLHQHTLIT